MASYFFFLTVAFPLFLMMAHASAETLNKIMFSIIVAVLFAIRICSNSVHCLPKVGYVFPYGACEQQNCIAFRQSLPVLLFNLTAAKQVFLKLKERCSTPNICFFSESFQVASTTVVHLR